MGITSYSGGGAVGQPVIRVCARPEGASGHRKLIEQEAAYALGNTCLAADAAVSYDQRHRCDKLSHGTNALRKLE